MITGVGLAAPNGSSLAEFRGSLLAGRSGVVHPTINVDDLDPECAVRNLVANEPRDVGRVETILNMSFGMLGINSAVVVGRCRV